MDEPTSRRADDEPTKTAQKLARLEEDEPY